jgi:hypothetical protein
MRPQPFQALLDLVKDRFAAQSETVLVHWAHESASHGATAEVLGKGGVVDFGGDDQAFARDLEFLDRDSDNTLRFSVRVGAMEATD